MVEDKRTTVVPARLKEQPVKGRLKVLLFRCVMEEPVEGPVVGIGDDRVDNNHDRGVGILPLLDPQRLEHANPHEDPAIGRRTILDLTIRFDMTSVSGGEEALGHLGVKGAESFLPVHCPVARTEVWEAVTPRAEGLLPAARRPRSDNEDDAHLLGVVDIEEGMPGSGPPAPALRVVGGGVLALRARRGGGRGGGVGSHKANCAMSGRRTWHGCLGS